MEFNDMFWRTAQFAETFYTLSALHCTDFSGKITYGKPFGVFGGDVHVMSTRCPCNVHAMSMQCP